jgi:hypothetical protein
MVKLNSRGLLALTLPDNLEQPLLNLQRRLFGELGLVSALALPPLLPLLWTEEPARLEHLRDLTRSTTLAIAIPEAAPTWEEGEIVVPVRVAPGRNAPADGELLEEVRERGRSICTPLGADSPPFSLLEGFRIATEEEPTEESPGTAGPGELGPASPPWASELERRLPGIRESSAAGASEAISVASFELSVGDERRWWRHLFYREIARKRFRTVKRC